LVFYEVQAQQSNMNSFLQRWDTDHDGTLSIEEIREAATAQFEKLDRRHRGKLSRDQLAGIVTFRQFRAADRDRKGTLDKSEFLALAESLFQRVDKNHNGTVDKGELGSAPGRALTRLFGTRKAPIF
jgi:Ca2+-binding EF-hand superfamily protein